MNKHELQQRLIRPPNPLVHARLIGLRRVHRVDVPLQKPFDHDTGELYDPHNHRKAD